MSDNRTTFLYPSPNSRHVIVAMETQLERWFANTEDLSSCVSSWLLLKAFLVWKPHLVLNFSCTPSISSHVPFISSYWLYINLFLASSYLFFAIFLFTIFSSLLKKKFSTFSSSLPPCFLHVLNSQQTPFAIDPFPSFQPFHL